ncbi:LppU/SCO3897 family protein [Saccharopolyspora sp. 5N708]|uniref:LppU/SCO3897 family protein n=1 Tax=Saccharopolyspora sp. 5N708 TaxID=3457424 RepID=UPI003FD536DA
MRKEVLLLVGGLLAATPLTACVAVNAGLPNSSVDRTASDVDIRPTTTPRPGDCVGIDSDELWVVDCANRNAVARVTRQVPTGQSDSCTTDDYVGFDFHNTKPSNAKPSLCLMLHGDDGDCYQDFDTRLATGGRVDCTDPTAKVRLQRVVDGDARTACPQFAAPGDPNAVGLFYGNAPDFDATPITSRDVTFCLASPNS